VAVFSFAYFSFPKEKYVDWEEEKWYTECAERNEVMICG
jgi:hypothetical protein